MSKKAIYSLLVISLLLIITGCSTKKQNANVKKTNVVDEENTNNEVSLNNYIKESDSVKILIDNIEYTIDLENNETAKAFTSMLPLEFDMSELNGNEKYVYLDGSLPTNSTNPKRINVGDVMLYGNNCLVIFYKSFDTNYSYTKIGHINNFVNLGNGSINVKIGKEK